jgi:hypothetical protein
VIQYHGILHFSGEVVALLVPFLSLFIYLAFKHCSLIKSFNSIISSHDTESQFVSPCLHETRMKPNWNENWNCQHVYMRPVWKSKFSIYSLCQAIFFFRWLLLACVVHLFQCQGYIRDRSELDLCLHSFRSEFMPVWSQSAWSSRRNDLRLVWVIFVLVSYKHLLYIILWLERSQLTGTISCEGDLIKSFKSWLNFSKTSVNIVL